MLANHCCRFAARFSSPCLPLADEAPQAADGEGKALEPPGSSRSLELKLEAANTGNQSGLALLVHILFNRVAVRRGLGSLMVLGSLPTERFVLHFLAQFLPISDSGKLWFTPRCLTQAKIRCSTCDPKNYLATAVSF